MSNLAFNPGDPRVPTILGSGMTEPPVSPPVLGAPRPVVPQAPAPAPAPVPTVAPIPTAAPQPAEPLVRRDLTRDELFQLPLQALLVRAGLITLDQLADALRENVASGKPVESIVVERGWAAAGDVHRIAEAKASFAPAPVAAAPAPAPAEHVESVFPVAAVPANDESSERPEEQVDETVAVFLNLSNGERLWIGRFKTEADGERRAAEIIAAFLRPMPGEWPRFGNRFVRPEAVVSVELSRRRDN